MQRPCLLAVSSRIILVIRAGLLGVKMSAPQTPRRRILKEVVGYQSRFPKGRCCVPPEHTAGGVVQGTPELRDHSVVLASIIGRRLIRG